MKKGKTALLIRLILIIGGVFLLMVMLISIPRLSHFFGNDSKRIKYRSFGIEIPKGFTVHGIDVSRHQEKIDWELADSMISGGKEISFAFIKATEGITRQDPNFKRNWLEVKKTEILRGAYHFYYPSRDAVKQADNFIRNVQLTSGDLPPVVDIEHSNGKNKKEIIAGLQIYLNRIEKKFGVKPIIYTNHSFFIKYLQGTFDEYPLWISYYTDKATFTRNCKYPYLIWQHSEKGKVNGIKGPVDFNVFNGGMQKLHSLTIR